MIQREDFLRLLQPLREPRPDADQRFMRQLDGRGTQGEYPLSFPILQLDFRARGEKLALDELFQDLLLLRLCELGERRALADRQRSNVAAIVGEAQEDAAHAVLLRRIADGLFVPLPSKL